MAKKCQWIDAAGPCSKAAEEKMFLEEGFMGVACGFHAKALAAQFKMTHTPLIRRRTKPARRKA